MNNGGLAHFKVTERGFEFLHYFPGAYYNDCVVPPGPSATFHTLYCVLNYYGMGLEASFGSVTIPPKGDVEFTLLMDAGYYNGRGPTVDCKGGMERHHFFSLAYDSERRRVVLGVAVPDFGVKDAACRRLAKRDFRSDEDPDNVEYALREHKGLLKETDERYTQAFISYDTSLPLARLKTSAEVVYTNENAPPG